MKFNTKRKLEVANENIEIYRNMVPKPGQPKGNFGQSDIEFYIGCVIIGRGADAAFLLPRALGWIDEAIAEDEELGVNHNLYRSNLHHARMIGGWLETGILSQHHASKARLYQEVAWRDEQYPWPMREILQEGLQDFLALAVLSGDLIAKQGDGYEAGVQMYEHWVPNPPVSAKKLTKPADIGYGLCSYYAHQKFSLDEVIASGRKMLRAHLDEHWLGRGQYLRAATWLMIIHWHRYLYEDTAPPDPVTILQMAYDDMPDETRPF